MGADVRLEDVARAFRGWRRDKRTKGIPEELWARAAGAAPGAGGESRFERSSVITGRLSGVDDKYGLTEITHPAGTIWLAGRAGPIGREVRVVIKATDVTLSTAKTEHLSVRTTLAGTVAGIETGDGPLASVQIDLDGHGKLLALATRKAIDDMGIGRGDRVYALLKTVALDERAVAETAP